MPMIFAAGATAKLWSLPSETAPQTALWSFLPRVSDIEPDRTYWLLDRAILIPENTTIVLRNCTIRESHGWGISLEACAFGHIEKIRFDALHVVRENGMVNVATSNIVNAYISV